MSIKVNITDKQKKMKLPTGTRLLVRKSCVATLERENYTEPAEIEVTFVSDEQIRELNRKFRNIDDSTDVLSFPLGENGIYDTNPATGAKMLGDVIISVEHAEAQAELYGHGFEREVAFLTVHSVLHLLGYDHVNGGLERAIMREKEEQILTDLGLAINKV